MKPRPPLCIVDSMESLLWRTRSLNNRVNPSTLWEPVWDLGVLTYFWDLKCHLPSWWGSAFNEHSLSIRDFGMHSVGPTLRSSPRTTFCLLTTCEYAHYISPHELVASFMTGKSARESQRRRDQCRDIKTGQATHLWDPDSAVSELGGDASLPSSACISRLAPFYKTGTDFERGI